MTTIDTHAARVLEAAARRFTELAVVDAAAGFVAAYRDRGFDYLAFRRLALASDSLTSEEVATDAPATS